VEPSYQNPSTARKSCKEVLKKFGMATSCFLDKDESGTKVNQTMYRGII